jgi:tRNA (adenine57-N1/adenine58-N1)-methyltransferase
MDIAKEGDLVFLVSKDRKPFLVRLKAGHEKHTHRGIVRYDDIIGQRLGREVRTQLDSPFLVLEPSIHDLIKNIKRISQIMYPKDIGYILLKMNIMSGRRVIEAGTGSGGLTLALAHSVRPDGRVYSYEIRPDMLKTAIHNLENAGLLDYVDFRERDIGQGFDERDVDALFLDMRTPWHYLEQAYAALKSGGFFGAILPTTNQVVRLIGALPHSGFFDVEVEELLLRPYKAVYARLRPMDRMVAHTGYLIFARKIVGGEIMNAGEDEEAENAFTHFQTAAPKNALWWADRFVRYVAGREV